MHQIPDVCTVIGMHPCRADQAGGFQLKHFGTKTIQILNQPLEM
jgi:hypothetical protein